MVIVELFRRVQLTLAIYYDSRVSPLADHPGLTLSGVTFFNGPCTAKH